MLALKQDLTKLGPKAAKGSLLKNGRRFRFPLYQRGDSVEGVTGLLESSLGKYMGSVTYYKVEFMI